jgi:hypothetical protein
VVRRWPEVGFRETLPSFASSPESNITNRTTGPYEISRERSGKNCYRCLKIDLGIMQCTPLRISTTCETRQSPTIEVSE